MGKFINPYTFVPFPQVDPVTFRRAPACHDRLGKTDSGESRFLGRVEVVLTARSPLLVRDGEGRFPRRAVPGGGEPVPYLPGSALAGVFRSLHESVAGGCLRVFDGEFVPVYRDIPVPRGASWQLALVENVRGGRPCELRLCDQVVHVRADVLASQLGGADRLVTGARINVHNPDSQGRVTQAKDVTAGEEWVVLVTDSRARNTKHPYYCTAGRLTDEVLRWERDEEWEDGWGAAWEDYQKAVHDADDMRRARADREGQALHPTRGPVEAKVRFGNSERLVGLRHEARGELFRGQVLWVKPGPQIDGKRGVAGLALSTIWRHVGWGQAGERVPGVLLGCDDPDLLCPTCRVFGAADTEGAPEDSAEQRGYRGHVRFSDGLPEGRPMVHERWLPALGRPRPGAGQFYLSHDRDQRRWEPTPEESPIREWGSRADEPGLRSLRGRKQYWLTGDHTKRPLFRVTNGPPGGTDAEEGHGPTNGEVVSEGSQFTCVVSFENLNLAELGALLAALDPSLVLRRYLPPEAEVGFAVGGGRPLGFGTCTSEVTGLEVHTAESWYGTAPALETGVAEAVAAFLHGVDPGVRRNWRALSAALHVDHVPPTGVWYPTTGDIEDGGPLTVDDLKPDFDFWHNSQGRATRNKVFPLLPLPEVVAQDQRLPAGGSPPRSRVANSSRKTGRSGGGR